VIKQLKVVHGHTSPDTARVVEDYPYGSLKCTIRYWIETGTKGAGKDRQRFMSQTTNPKRRPGVVWNKPKASTYEDMLVMVVEEQPDGREFVRSRAISATMSPVGWHRVRLNGILGQLTEEQAKRHALWLAHSKQVWAKQSWVSFDETVVKVAAHIRDTGEDPILTNGTWLLPDGGRMYIGDHDIDVYTAVARERLAEASTEDQEIDAALDAIDAL
jgi:hypothetical protein